MTDEKSGFAQLKAEASDPADVLLEFDLGWLEATLDASYWWEMKDVQPKDAAILLCGLNPRDGTTDPTKGESHEIKTADYVRLLNKFEDEARAIPECRTIRQWLLLAKSAGLKHHPWIDNWMASTGRRLDAVSAVDSHAPNTNPVQIIRTQKSRGHPLDAVIHLAQLAAVNPADYQSVWPALVDLAESENPPLPLTGYAPNEGVLYSTDRDPCKAFTKSALRKRMNPKAR